MFQQIVARLKSSNRINEISGIEHSPSEPEGLFENTGLVSSIKKEKYFLEGSSFSNHGDSFSNSMEHNIPWIEQQNQEE